MKFPCDGGLTRTRLLPTLRGYSGAAKKVESRVCSDRTLDVRGRRRREKSKAARVQDAVRIALSALSSQLSALRSCSRLVVLITSLCASAIAQVSPQSTHDWTSTPPPPVSVPDSQLFITEDLNEVWADTKSPGDGFTYSVGSIEIRDTNLNEVTGEGPKFSGEDVGLPPDIPTTPPVLARFRLQVPSGGTILPKRQVVILQCVDQFGTIQWQRHFYGGSPGVTVARYRCATNARGISVWPGPTAEETRIAICGEQNDDILPLSQAGTDGSSRRPPSFPRDLTVASSLSTTAEASCCGRTTSSVRHQRRNSIGTVRSRMSASASRAQAKRRGMSSPTVASPTSATPLVATCG